MKTFTTPGVKETREILVKLKVKKAPKAKARAAVEGIRAKLEAREAKCQKGFSMNEVSKTL